MSEAQALHHEIVAASRDHHAAAHRLAVLLARLAQTRLYLDLGYATIHDYARTALDLDVRKTRALLQLGRATGELPALDRAFAEGHIGWTKAREILRVATPDTVSAWVDRAREVSSRELERQVSDRILGESPPKAGEPAREPARQRLVFTLEGTDAVVLRDALAVLRHELGESAGLDDGALLALLAQRYLQQADRDVAPTGERYRVTLDQCVDCGRTHGVDVDVTETIVAEAACDAEVVDMRPGPTRGHVSRTIPPARRRAVLHRDRMRCAVPGCGCRLWLDVHHLHERSRGGDHDERNLLTLCAAHHRLIHLGLLAVWLDRDGDLVFTFATGRVLVRPPRPTWAAGTRGPIAEAGVLD